MYSLLDWIEQLNITVSPGQSMGPVLWVAVNSTEAAKSTFGQLKGRDGSEIFPMHYS